MFLLSLRGLAKQSTVHERIGILCSLIATLAPLARNDNRNLVMLSEAKHLGGATSVALIDLICAVKTAPPILLLLSDSDSPATARNVYVRVRKA